MLIIIFTHTVLSELLPKMRESACDAGCTKVHGILTVYVYMSFVYMIYAKLYAAVENLSRHTTPQVIPSPTIVDPSVWLAKC